MDNDKKIENISGHDTNWLKFGEMVYLSKNEPDHVSTKQARKISKSAHLNNLMNKLGEISERTINENSEINVQNPDALMEKLAKNGRIEQSLDELIKIFATVGFQAKKQIFIRDTNNEECLFAPEKCSYTHLAKIYTKLPDGVDSLTEENFPLDVESLNYKKIHAAFERAKANIPELKRELDLVKNIFAPEKNMGLGK